jgi:UDP-N-acetylglucosamine transferase subunit ALG13
MTAPEATSDTTPDARPLIFVTVGTDHHRFDRLIDSIAKWAVRNPGARIVVQHGNAHAIDGVECSAFLAPERFRELLATADAVVCPGGPGGIMETRAAGLRPIVMPRRGDLGEHVDNHQLAFSRFLADHDLVTLAEHDADLVVALDRLLESRDAYRIPANQESPSGIAGVGALIDDLVWGNR